MEDCGFSIVPCARASPELIAAAKAEFQTALQASYKESSELSCVAIKAFGPNCRALFNHEVELDTNEFIASRCGPYSDAVKDEAIMLTLTNSPQLPPYKLGPGKVFLFKPIDHDLSEEVGFLKYFEGSHIQSKSIGNAPERGICLTLDQMLVMDGDLVIRWPKAGGGIFILQGILKNRA